MQIASRVASHESTPSAPCCLAVRVVGVSTPQNLASEKTLGLARLQTSSAKEY